MDRSAYEDCSTRVPRSGACYTSRIIKAGALLPDTKTLLSHWDLTESVQTNLQRLQRENVFGKASRSRVEDIVAIFRQRYLTEPSVTRALVTLVKMRLPASALDRILYFHAAKADRLLHDVVTEILGPMNARGLSDISVDEIQKTVARWVKEGKTNLGVEREHDLPCHTGTHVSSAGLRNPPRGGSQADRTDLCPCDSLRLRHVLP